MKLTPDRQYEYDERVAICTADGIPEHRAREMAEQQLREREQPVLLGRCSMVQMIVTCS